MKDYIEPTINSFSELKQYINNLLPNRILYESIKYNYLLGVKKAILNGCDTSNTYYDKNDAIHLSILNNNIEIFKYLWVNDGYSLYGGDKLIFFMLKHKKFEISDYTLSNFSVDVETAIKWLLTKNDTDKEIIEYMLSKDSFVYGIKQIKNSIVKNKIDIIIRNFKLNKIYGNT